MSNGSGSGPMVNRLSWSSSGFFFCFKMLGTIRVVGEVGDVGFVAADSGGGRMRGVEGGWRGGEGGWRGGEGGWRGVEGGGGGGQEKEGRFKCEA